VSDGHDHLDGALGDPIVVMGADAGKSSRLCELPEMILEVG
jgi:hypothetical protein